jgi:endonuclease YncB( thermonuclease family)
MTKYIICITIYSGIDAPEMNQEYGKEAKAALRELIQDKPLRILVYGSDPYDRLVGDVYCNDIFIQVQFG